MAMNVDREPFAAGMERTGEAPGPWFRSRRQAFEQHLGSPRSTRCHRYFDVQQPRGIAAEDRPALGIV
jgi:hypothetical protein